MKVFLTCLILIFCIGNTKVYSQIKSTSGTLQLSNSKKPEKKKKKKNKKIKYKASGQLSVGKRNGEKKGLEIDTSNEDDNDDKSVYFGYPDTS